MAIDMSLIVSPLVIFFGALILVVIAIIILSRLERKLKKNIEMQKQESSFYREKIARVRDLTDSPQKFFTALNDLTQEFLSREFKLEKGMRYSDLTEIFKEKNRPDIVKFCEELQESFYSGQCLDKQLLEYLLNELVFLIRKQKKLEARKGDATKTDLFSKLVISSARLETKIDEKLDSETSSIIKKKIISPVKEEVKKIKTPALVEEKILIKPKPEQKTLNQKKKNSRYQEFVRTIDNLDRVKEKLIKSGKPMRF